MHEMRRWGLLLGVLLAGCAATDPSAREQVATLDTSLEAEREEADSCLTLLCDEEVCGFYLCEDVAAAMAERESADEAAGEPGRVVLARGAPVGVRLPSPVNPTRYRGWPLKLPEDREPVFVIPWKNHHLNNLLPSQKQLLAEAALRMRRPHEKHHIFTQELHEWFKEKGIDIHQWTMLIETDLHRRIHNGPRGGPWNEAWRQFKNAKPRATKEEIWKHAWELCIRFGLFAPLQPYYGRVRLPPPIGFMRKE